MNECANGNALFEQEICDEAPVDPCGPPAAPVIRIGCDIEALLSAHRMMLVIPWIRTFLRPVRLHSGMISIIL